VLIIISNITYTNSRPVLYIKERFYEELEHVFDKFPNYHMKIVLGDFNAKVGREDFQTNYMGMRVYTKLVMIMESE
jgi:hypothetical protein